jgi:hypothetical protein
MWNTITLWQSPRAAVDTNYAYAVRDMFTFQLPPWLPGLGGLDGVELVLTGYQESGSVIDMPFDFASLIPVDGWRHLESIGYGCAHESRIVDDGIDERLYRDAGDGTGRVGVFVGYGSPIMLHPGKDQRLYFLQQANVANVAEIIRSLSVKLYHRPRRRAL